MFAERHIKILGMEQRGKGRKILKLKISNQKCQMNAVYFGDIERFEQYIRDEYGEGELNNLYRQKKK